MNVEGRVRCFVWGAMAVLCFAAQWPSAVDAQPRPELSSADHLALLYAPQLNFTRQGDPVIRVGIIEGRGEVSFTPTGPIRVMPRGMGGSETVLPGGRRYTVTIKDGKAGGYRHWVVVDSFDVTDRKQAKAQGEIWREKGHDFELVEVGGLFAIRGQVFDSRILLVGLPTGSDLQGAERLRDRIQSQSGTRVRIHSELDRRPSGHLILRGEGLNLEVRNRNVFWIAGDRQKGKPTTFVVERVPRSYGKGEETRKYQGTLIFSPDRTGQLVVSVSLGAEKLLQGVVASEIYSSAPTAALEAQAVAARNEIFSALGVKNLADPYMLRGDVMDQVYRGVGVEKASTTRAVKATRGQVMFYEGKIIDAFYSSNAGGFTENNEEVWGMKPRPYLRGKADAEPSVVPEVFRDGVSEEELETFLGSEFPAHSRSAPIASKKHYRWTRKVGVKAPMKWLVAQGHEVGQLRDVRVLSRGVSGRVVQLEVEGSKGRVVVERELNVRRLFGGLRSGLFVMNIDRKSQGLIKGFRFRGAGFGHGVGMCQTGAAGMASQGKDYKGILQHYYQGIEVRKLY